MYSFLRSIIQHSVEIQSYRVCMNLLQQISLMTSDLATSYSTDMLVETLCCERREQM